CMTVRLVRLWWCLFFFSSRRRHTRFSRDWSSDVCSSDLELTEQPSLHAQPVGRVVEVLGGIDDPGMEIEIAVRKYEVPHRFKEDVLAQAAKLPEKLRAADKKNRIDLTDVPLVTIDGEDARDFDDAVYCQPATIGRGKTPNAWRLLVAIADVSHYVKPGEPLDRDAYERATS